MEQLGGLDAGFISCETSTIYMQVCGLLVFDTSAAAKAYSFARVRSLLLERLVRAPLLRQKVDNVPLNLGRPFWVDDADFDIDRHVHCTRVAPPGDERSLADLAGDIAGRPLRRDRPLWELWVIEGLQEGRIATLTKMHHSTIDGISGANLLSQLLDLEPDPPAGSVPAIPWKPQRPPAALELLGRSMAQRFAEPMDILRLFPTTAIHLGALAWDLAKTRNDGVQMALPFTAPRTSFNATVTSERCVAFVDVPLADIKAVKDGFGVTVNDVVTTVMGGALRRYLEQRGELPARSLIAAEPVAVHDQTATSAGATKVSVMFATLATDIEDPVERLRIIAPANAKAKEVERLIGAETLVQWAEHFWLNAFSLGSRLYSGLHMADHHPVVHNFILSNVPGPSFPLYMAGAPMIGAYPLGPLTDGAGLNVTVLSDEDRLGFGVISCPDLVPRIWDLADAIPGALGELVERLPSAERPP